MKEFFEIINPLILIALIVLIIIIVFSLIGYVLRNRLVKNAIENKLDKETLLKIGGFESPGAVIFKNALANTPALLAFSLLLINGYLVLGGVAVPAFMSNAFFVAIGFYFGKKFTGKDKQNTL